MILSTIHFVLVVGIVVLVICALLSPLESLRWFAGWSDDEPEAKKPTSNDTNPGNPGQAEYIVWLSGIGSVPGETEDPYEVRFLSKLKARIPQAIIVDDAFAYSVRENPLAGKRVVDRAWRAARAGQAAGTAGVLLGTAIQLRNTLQVAVSADGRYGPIYNLGIAEAIGKRLTARGYLVPSRKPITLIGYSGGGQVAVGAARYLKSWLDAPITVISIGGVVSADPGLEVIEHLYHLQGQKDPIPGIGRVAFVGCWPFIAYSYWNQAVKADRVTVIPAGPVGHMAESGYFGAAHVDHTASLVCDLITEPPHVVHGSAAEH
jgi:hypothetical protein